MTVHELTLDLCAMVDDPGGVRSYTKMLRCLSHSLQDVELNVIPGIKSFKLTVSDNLTAVIPENALDVIQVGKYVAYDVNNQFVYPLGKSRENVNPFETIVKPSKPFGCEEIPVNPNDVDKSHYYAYENLEGHTLYPYYMPVWYGEIYGYMETRFYGSYTFDKEFNRVVISHTGIVNPGDEVLVKAKVYSKDKANAVIDVQARSMLHHRTLQYYWQSSRPSISNNHFQLFKIELREYKSNRDLMSMDDYIDAITSAYSKVPR